MIIYINHFVFCILKRNILLIKELSFPNFIFFIFSIDIHSPQNLNSQLHWNKLNTLTYTRFCYTIKDNFLLSSSIIFFEDISYFNYQFTFFKQCFDSNLSHFNFSYNHNFHVHTTIFSLDKQLISNFFLSSYMSYDIVPLKGQPSLMGNNFPSLT